MPTVNVSSPGIGQLCSDMETSAPSIGLPFRESIFCAGASPVKTSVLPENVQGLTAHDPACGLNTSEPFAIFDPASSSWRTSQVSCLTLTWDVYLETWPRAGTMRNGIVFQQVPLAPLTGEIECGYLPTPTATDWKRTPMKKSYAYRPITDMRGDTLAQWVVRHSGLSHARLVPDLWEWVMGYPPMWTDLGDSATPSSRRSRKR